MVGSLDATSSVGLFSIISASIKSGSWETERSRLWTDDSEPESESEATDSGGDWARWRFAVDLD